MDVEDHQAAVERHVGWSTEQTTGQRAADVPAQPCRQSGRNVVVHGLQRGLQVRHERRRPGMRRWISRYATRRVRLIRGTVEHGSFMRAETRATFAEHHVHQANDRGDLLRERVQPVAGGSVRRRQVEWVEMVCRRTRQADKLSTRRIADSAVFVFRIDDEEVDAG